MYLKPLKIGNVTLENNILLAPMAGITDKAFRKICKKYGIDFIKKIVQETEKWAEQDLVFLLQKK